MIEILHIPYDKEGEFIERVNRFVGKLRVDDEIVLAHIHDTGRLSELLYRGNRVLLKKAKNPHRKTQWDVIAALFDGEWIFTNSSYHSEIFHKTLLKLPEFGLRGFKIKREVKVGTSRLDFVLTEKNRKILVEVKGCTLREEDVAMFPDAPTERGKKHVLELIEAIKDGYEAWLVFLIMHTKARCFSPNRKRDRDFAEVFTQAIQSGVKIIPLKYKYDGRVLWYVDKAGLC